MADKLIIDCSKPTAQPSTAPLTSQEQAEKDQMAAAAAADASVTATQETNRTTLRQQATNALATNRTYIGLASPSAAQTAAQVKALSRQMNAMIRLALNQVDATD